MLALEHFVRSTQTVFVQITQKSVAPASALAVFELGNGSRVVVSKEKLQGVLSSQVYSWKPNQVLAFVEGKVPTKAVSIAGFNDKNLASMSSEQYMSLQKNPFLFASAVSSPGNEPQLEAAATEWKAAPFPATSFSKADAVTVDRKALMQDIRYLSGLDPVTIDGQAVKIPERGSAASRELTKRYLKNYFASLGLESNIRCYGGGFFGKGCNVEATQWGSDTSKMVLFTAHLDSVANKGADDDASGLAAMMEIAKVMSKRSPTLSIRFVGFDQEEIGLVGSKAYVNDGSQEPNPPAIVGVFQADMIGYDSNNDNAFHAMDCKRADSKPLTALLDNVNSTLALGLKKVDACTNRSDHASFWNKNLPATIVSENFFGGDENKCYHQKCDTIDLINETYFAKIVTLLANTAVALAN